MTNSQSPSNQEASIIQSNNELASESNYEPSDVQLNNEPSAVQSNDEPSIAQSDSEVLIRLEDPESDQIMESTNGESTNEDSEYKPSFIIRIPVLSTFGGVP
jgi:hypothetical protein